MSIASTLAPSAARQRLLRRSAAGAALGVNVRVLPVDGPARRDTTHDVVERDTLDRGFRRLPVEQRAIFILHHYLGLTLGEIADTLDVPLGTVKSRLHYATNTLRAALEADARTVDRLAGAPRMNGNTDFDRLAQAWLPDGPTEMPDRALQAALDEVHVTPQRRFGAAWRTSQ